MVDLRKYKWPIFILVILIVVLMVLLSVGFTIGILSEDPDGLERTLISYRGEEWLENLPSAWIPWLSWIESSFISGILGIMISVGLIIAVFYLISYVKKSR